MLCVGTRDIPPLQLTEMFLDSVSNSLVLPGWRQSQSVFCVLRRAACHVGFFPLEYGKIMSEVVGS